ncbi:hypothetical protein KW782_04985 [Candidatus Parcubacteria bacterium]|nr:hypothetical protein [Candidatus Parcubacteria bacterium]
MLKKFVLSSKFFYGLGIVVLIVAVFNVAFILTHYLDYNTNVDNRVAKIALAKNNPQECSKIWSFPLLYIFNDMNPPEYHINLCYVNVAVETANPEICEHSTDKAYCFSEVAKVKNDILICDQISEGEGGYQDRGRCYALFTRKGIDKSVCENLHDEDNKASCYVGAVNFNPDRAICDTKIIGGQYYSTNKSECYWIVAIDTKDVSLCKNTIESTPPKSKEIHCSVIQSLILSSLNHVVILLLM